MGLCGWRGGFAANITEAITAPSILRRVSVVDGSGGNVAAAVVAAAVVAGMNNSTTAVGEPNIPAAGLWVNEYSCHQSPFYGYK